MKVTRISKYGFQVDNSSVWNNWDKSYTNHPKLKLNDNIEFEKNKDGYVDKISVVYDDSSGLDNALDSKEFRSPDEIIRGECLSNAVAIMPLMDNSIKKDPVISAIEISKEFEKYVRDN